MSLELPDFQTESEEADWWYTHREEVEAEFLVAAAEGRLTQRAGGDEHFVEPLNIDAADLARAKSTLLAGHQPLANSALQENDLRQNDLRRAS